MTSESATNKEDLLKRLVHSWVASIREESPGEDGENSYYVITDSNLVDLLLLLGNC